MRMRARPALRREDAFFLRRGVFQPGRVACCRVSFLGRTISFRLSRPISAFASRQWLRARVAPRKGAAEAARRGVVSLFFQNRLWWCLLALGSWRLWRAAGGHVPRLILRSILCMRTRRIESAAGVWTIERDGVDVDGRRTAQTYCACPPPTYARGVPLRTRFFTLAFATYFERNAFRILPTLPAHAVYTIGIGVNYPILSRAAYVHCTSEYK
jgi:hypothetical protein